MPFEPVFSPLQPLTRRFEAVEQSLSRPANAVSFLVVRFVLMSGMVLGFTWCSLHFSP